MPPFLHGFPLQPLMTDSQRRPGDESGCEGFARPARPPSPPSPPDAPTGVAGTALAVEVVDTLHTVLGPAGVAGIGQALVDVTLAALTHEAGQAGAAVAAHLVHAGAIVEALGAPRDGVDGGAAVIHVDLTVYTYRGHVPSGTREDPTLAPASSRGRHPTSGEDRTTDTHEKQEEGSCQWPGRTSPLSPAPASQLGPGRLWPIRGDA